MLSENDLTSKIAEYQSKSSVTESECVKLAAFMTIRDCLFPQDNADHQMYSASSAPDKSLVEYGSDSEFFNVANGMEIDRVWKIVDELVDAVRVINPRLYSGVIRKLEEG